MIILLELISITFKILKSLALICIFTEGIAIIIILLMVIVLLLDLTYRPESKQYPFNIILDINNNELMAKSLIFNTSSKNPDPKTGEKPGKNLLTHLTQDLPMTIDLGLSMEDIQNSQIKFRMGVLKEPIGVNRDVTELLRDIHKHVIIYYETFDNKLVLWSYLTSDKTEVNIVLTENQPFVGNVDETTNKQQRLRITNKPILIRPSDLEILSPELCAIAENYLEQVSSTLQGEFLEKVAPHLQGSIVLYDGKGYTLEDMNQGWTPFEAAQNKQYLKWWQEFKSIHSLDKQLNFINTRKNGKTHFPLAYELFLERVKKEHPEIYNKLKIVEDIIGKNEKNTV